MRGAGAKARSSTDAGEGGLALLTHRMTRRDVTDLVPEHRGELRLGVQVIHDAARDVDVTATRREGVDLFAVEHGEEVLQVRAFARLRCPLTDFVDVLLQTDVVVRAAELLQHQRMDLLCLLDFRLLGREHEVGPAADRIRGAGTECQNRCSSKQCSAYKTNWNHDCDPQVGIATGVL